MTKPTLRQILESYDATSYDDKITVAYNENNILNAKVWRHLEHHGVDYLDKEINYIKIGSQDELFISMILENV